MTEDEKRVLGQIDINWSKELNFLAGMVKRPSLRGDEALVQNYIAAELSTMGFEAELWDIDHAQIARAKGYSPVEWSYKGRPNLSSRWKSPDGTGRSLILNSHIDVVPATPEHFWHFDPWGAEIHEGLMYGRGAADMKSGAAAMIYALHAIKQAGLELKADVILETVIEEECTGNGALATLTRGLTAAACIIPEPFYQTLLAGQVGVMWARITVRGAGAHVFGANKAINAIDKAYEVIKVIKRLEQAANEAPKPDAYKDIPHPLNYNVGMLHAGDWASSVPSEAVMEVRIGAYPGADLVALQESFKAQLLEGLQEDDWLSKHPPQISFYAFVAEGCYIKDDNPILAPLAKAHMQIMGYEVIKQISTATTDARFFELYHNIPTTCYGPIGGNLHAPDEWVDLESVKNTTKVLALAIMDWCGVI